MEIQHHGADIVGSAAVMVYHTHLVDGFQQGLELHLIRPVGVHHHQDASLVAGHHSLLPGDKHALILRHLEHLRNQFGGGIMLQINHNIGRFALLAAQAADAHGRTQAVQVCIAVPHDKHLAALADKLHKGTRRNPGAHLAAVLRLHAAATEEGKIHPILDDRLVAAPAQRHFDAQRCEIIGFLKAAAVHAQADGHGGRQTGGTGDAVDILQQGEFMIHCILQIPLFKHEQESVPFQLSQKPLVRLRPEGDGIVELGIESRDGAFREVAGQLLIVIHHDDGHHRAGADVFVPHLIQLRQVVEVDNAHQRRAVFLLHCRAEQPVAAAIER